jgi:hypothetical protein
MPNKTVVLHILHLTEPEDKLEDGIADYCSRLILAQRESGIEARSIVSHSVSNIGKLS